MKFQYKLLILLAVFSGHGCNKFLDIDPPKDQLATESVFNLNETAIASMTSIYSSMINATEISPSRIPFLTGLSGDEFKNNSTALDGILVYQNDILPTNSYTTSLWTKAYNLIILTNKVFEGCEASNALDPDVRRQLMGEARFVRAYWFFYLINLYGNIPLTLSSDYKINSNLTRTATSTVYDQIVADLKYAKDNLNAGYVMPNTITTADDRIRPNKATATALLARVYLYTKKYVDAEEQATSIINQSNTYGLPSLDVAFLKNSKETIWAITPTTPNTRNTPEGADFILIDKPSNLGQPSVSESLQSTFDSSDQRKNKWIGKFTDVNATPNVDYYYAYKYKIKTSATINEYSIIFRLAEQYLIRAEARAQQNNLAGAIADVDMIRQRAGILLIANTNPNISKNDLISSILKERQRELFAEQGHQWLDLKRTGTVDAVMVPATAKKGGTWNTLRQLWPIPQTEILNNPNIKQNPGYN